MASPFIFVKDLNAATFTADLASYLGTGEVVQSINLLRLSPVTSPALTAALSFSGSVLSVDLDGGTENTSYGLAVDVTTQSRTFTVTCGVLIQLDLNVVYATRNAHAFDALVGTIEAGDAAIGKGVFMLPANVDASMGYVTWDIVDNTGLVYASGNAYTYYVTADAFSTMVEASAVVNVPSSTPPTLNQQRYVLRWRLSGVGADQYASESLTVTHLATVPLGPEHIVEMAGDNVQVGLVLDRAFPVVQVSLFQGNAPIVPLTDVTTKERVSSGWYYRAGLDTSQLPAALDPYLVSWKYSDRPGAPAFRQQGHAFLVNPMILSAVEDVQSRVMRARTTLLGNADMVFDPVTVMTWLRRGRDMFNAAYGLITSFTMTEATGGVREFWLSYSEIEALRAQYLAEGEKAFDFQGQAISLSVDRTQYYQGLADSIQQGLDNSVREYKKNLQIKGITSGTGDVANAVAGYGSMGCVGIGWNAVSPSFTGGWSRRY